MSKQCSLKNNFLPQAPIREQQSTVVVKVSLLQGSVVERMAVLDRCEDEIVQCSEPHHVGMSASEMNFIYVVRFEVPCF
jgi:hypothetical protein